MWCLCWFFAVSQMESNLSVLAAILAYSFNDSIIENKMGKQLITKPLWDVPDINNGAIKSTFLSSMVTSETTL
jgi:preprotein translocase subunit SecF